MMKKLRLLLSALFPALRRAKGALVSNPCLSRSCFPRHRFLAPIFCGLIFLLFLTLSSTGSLAISDQNRAADTFTQQTSSKSPIKLISAINLVTRNDPSAITGMNIWTTGGPDGGTIYSLAIDPDNSQIAYAGTGGRGVYKTTNGGLLWTSVSSDFGNVGVKALAVDPTNGQVVYALVTTGLYKTVNGGVSWTRATNGLPPFTTYGYGCLAIAADNSELLYMCTWGYMYKSVNGGASWEAVADGLPQEVEAIAIDPSNNQLVYAGTDGYGMYKSTDGGNSWTAINNGLGDPSGSSLRPLIHSIAIDPTDSDTVYRVCRRM